MLCSTHLVHCFLPYNAVPMLSCSVVLLELDNKIKTIKGTPNVISNDPWPTKVPFKDLKIMNERNILNYLLIFLIKSGFVEAGLFSRNNVENCRNLKLFKIKTTIYCSLLLR